MQATEQTTEQTTEEVEQNFYVLGYWCNPYRSDDREYFWARDFESRKEAAAFGKRKQENGQPKRFIDWVKGSNKIFSSVTRFKAECQKVGLNPRLD